MRLRRPRPALGRTYESFGEDPSLVIKMETAIDGFQGPRARELADRDRVLATAKHYAGDGDTQYGTGEGDYTIDQGITITNRRDFAPHRPGAVRPGRTPAPRRHRDAVLLQRRLDRGRRRQPDQDACQRAAHHRRAQGPDRVRRLRHLRLGGIHQLPDYYATQVRTGVNAGIDMFMEPFSYQAFETTLAAEVQAGRGSAARVDDAVRPILTRKFQLGLFEPPFSWARSTHW